MVGSLSRNICHWLNRWFKCPLSTNTFWDDTSLIISSVTVNQFTFAAMLSHLERLVSVKIKNNLENKSIFLVWKLFFLNVSYIIHLGRCKEKKKSDKTTNGSACLLVYSLTFLTVNQTSFPLASTVSCIRSVRERCCILAGRRGAAAGTSSMAENRQTNEKNKHKKHLMLKEVKWKYILQCWFLHGDDVQFCTGIWFMMAEQ